MTVVEIVITGPSRAIDQIVGELVKKKIVACAHAWEIHADFWWQGRIEQKHEVRAAMHTVERLIPLADEVARMLHPYEVSCFTCTKLSYVSHDYLEWVETTVRPPNGA